MEPAPGRGTVTVSELWMVANDADEAVEPGDLGTVRFVLPDDAFGLQLDDDTGAEATVEETTVVDRSPVPPGERQIVLRYEVPYDGTRLLLGRSADLPVESLSVVAIGPGVVIECPSLGPTRAEMVDGQPIAVAVGHDLPAGTELSLRVSGLAESEGGPAASVGAVSPAPARTVTAEWLNFWGLLVAIAGVAVTVSRSDRWRRTVEDRPHGARYAEYRSIVESAARLDDCHAAGELSDEAYRLERDRLVGEAVAILDSGEISK